MVFLPGTSALKLHRTGSDHFRFGLFHSAGQQSGSWRRLQVVSANSKQHQGEQIMTRLACFAALGAVLLASAGGAQQTPAPAAAGGNPLDVVPEKMPFDVSYGSPITLTTATVAINAAVAEAKKRDWK